MRRFQIRPHSKTLENQVLNIATIRRAMHRNARSDVERSRVVKLICTRFSQINLESREYGNPIPS